MRRNVPDGCSCIKQHERRSAETEYARRIKSDMDGRNQNVTYMECFGRLMAGLAPWLSLPDDETPEGLQRKQLREWALKSYANAVDPASPIICYGVRRIRPWWMPPSWQKVS